MAKFISLLVVFALTCLPVLAGTTSKGGNGVEWQTWSDSLFEKARQEGKLVILDLEAVWCHWCHVMDEKTYSDPEVGKILKSKFIAVKVDQDSRPDLSNKYEDYGWPATIVFNSRGAEIVKRSGYINPQDMVSMLKAVVKDPTPGPSAEVKPAIKFSSAAALPPDIKSELQDKHRQGYDEKEAGWGTHHKFLDPDSVEYAMAGGRAGDAQAEKRARATLTAQIKLSDPAWGGMYQYSTDGDWDHAHFEKIMSVQAEDLRIYALAHALYQDPSYLKAAEDIHKFLTTFLMDESGAFYTSQDADLVKGQHSEDYFKLTDAERRLRGTPRVDKHIYARENGWAINGLVALYAATGNDKYLNEAIKASDWIIANRSLPDGGFRHDQKDAAGPYLGDTLAMGRAFLSIYAATGERKWLTHAQKAADFISAHFDAQKFGSGAGFATADLKQASVQKPEPLLDENIAMARFANLLYHYSGNKNDRQLAEEAMKYLSTPEIARKRKILVAGILIADLELAADPAHITVVGRKDDAEAKSLFLAGLKYPSAYKRVEWWDNREGPLPNMDVEYPTLKKAAAFACANQRCSAPVYQADGVAKMVDRLNKS